MVKDLIIDMKERDLLLEDKSNSSMPVFDVVWGNIFEADDMVDVLICNIIIPSYQKVPASFPCKELSQYLFR